MLANDSIAFPAMAAGPTTILTYEVPVGLRFSLRAVVLAFFGTGWNEGLGDITFTVSVIAAGTRNIDFLVSVKTHLGSPEEPFPIYGRLEFGPSDILVVTVTNVNDNVSAGPPNAVTAMLIGHTYPNAEAEN